MSPRARPPVLSNVLRRRGERTACEERQAELRGHTLVLHRWTYCGGFSRLRPRSTSTTWPDARSARRAMAALVRELVADGWGELPAWPEVPADWGVPTRPKARAPQRPARVVRTTRPRLTPGRVRVEGTARPVKPARLAALERELGTATPASWRALLERFGAGTFAGRLRFPAPERVLRETRRFRRQYADEYRTFFINHDEVLGERAHELVMLASSIEGDRLAFLPGATGWLLVLPRNGQAIIVFREVAEVLGRYADLARELDGAAPTWTPQRS